MKLQFLFQLILPKLSKSDVKKHKSDFKKRRLTFEEVEIAASETPGPSQDNNMDKPDDSPESEAKPVLEEGQSLLSDTPEIEDRSQSPESEIEEKPSIESLCQSIDSIISGQNQPSRPDNGLPEETDTSQDTQELRDRLQRLREPVSGDESHGDGLDSTEVALPASENLQVDSENNLSKISKVTEIAQVENVERMPSSVAESSRPEIHEDLVENCDKNAKSPTPSGNEESASVPTPKTKPKNCKNASNARSVETANTRNECGNRNDRPEPKDQPVESNGTEDAARGSSDPELLPEVQAAPVEKDVDLTLRTVIEERPPPPAPNQNTSVTGSKKKLVLKSRKQANARAVSTPNKTIVMRQVRHTPKNILCWFRIYEKECCAWLIRS